MTTFEILNSREHLRELVDRLFPLGEFLGNPDDNENVCCPFHDDHRPSAFYHEADGYPSRIICRAEADRIYTGSDYVRFVLERDLCEFVLDHYAEEQIPYLWRTYVEEPRRRLQQRPRGPQVITNDQWSRWERIGLASLLDEAYGAIPYSG